MLKNRKRRKNKMKSFVNNKKKLRKRRRWEMTRMRTFSTHTMNMMEVRG